MLEFHFELWTFFMVYLHTTHILSEVTVRRVYTARISFYNIKQVLLHMCLVPATARTFLTIILTQHSVRSRSARNTTVPGVDRIIRMLYYRQHKFVMHVAVHTNVSSIITGWGAVLLYRTSPPPTPCTPSHLPHQAPAPWCKGQLCIAQPATLTLKKSSRKLMTNVKTSAVILVPLYDLANKACEHMDTQEQETDVCQNSNTKHFLKLKYV